MKPEETEILEQVRKQVAEAAAEDAAARQALGNPLPGPLKEAMAVNGDIPVGRWKVRRLCEGDFHILVELDHPIRKVMEMQFDMAFKGAKQDESVGFGNYSPRGESMWWLAWMMTRPAKTVWETVRHRGVAALKVAAEDEFPLATGPELVSIYMAVCQQVSVYWSTAQSYGPAGSGEDAAADAPANPSSTSSAAGSTGSAGA